MAFERLLADPYNGFHISRIATFLPDSDFLDYLKLLILQNDFQTWSWTLFWNYFLCMDYCHYSLILVCCAITMCCSNIDLSSVQRLRSSTVRFVCRFDPSGRNEVLRDNIWCYSCFSVFVGWFTIVFTQIGPFCVICSGNSKPLEWVCCWWRCKK